MNLLTQRRLAADLMKCGLGRVAFNPEAISRISKLTTRREISVAISWGDIYARRIIGQIHRTGRKRSYGTYNARIGGTKRNWIRKIRTFRGILSNYKDRLGANYRTLYNQIKGNFFNRAAILIKRIESILENA